MTKIASFQSKPFSNINKWTAWQEKCCLLFSNISFCSRDIQVFKICKLAKWWCHTLNQIFFRYDEKRYLSQFVSEMFDSLQWQILLSVLHNTSLTVLLPWQHTGFQTSPIFKAFLATFSVPFWYLLTALHMHEPASI